MKITLWKAALCLAFMADLYFAHGLNAKNFLYVMSISLGVFIISYDMVDIHFRYATKQKEQVDEVLSISMSPEDD